jgi:4-hydroxy-tetrahydrodipicolinate synthase
MFTGAGVALVTPFSEDLEPDLEALERLVEYVIAGGVDYLVVLGTTGEAPTLERDEKNRLFRAVREISRERVPLMAGIGGNSTKGVVTAMQELDTGGYDAILSVSPYYNKPTQEGIYRHYKTLAAVSRLPLVLYNVPSRTGSNMLPRTVLRLAKEVPNIMGIKEASGDMEQIRSLIRQVPRGFLVISGDDHTAVPTILEGGAGVISVAGQGIPETFTSMIRLAMDGRADEAREIEQKLAPLLKLLFKEGNPAGIKGLLSLHGLCLPSVRLPLVAPSPGLLQALQAFMERTMPETTDEGNRE